MKKTLILAAALIFNFQFSISNFQFSISNFQFSISNFQFFPPLHAQDYHRQYASWGFAAGPNISSYIMKVDPLLRDTLIADTVLSSLPSTGLSFGLFLDYHITDRWALQMNGQLALGQSLLRYADHHSHLLTLGTDVGLAVRYRAPWRKGAFLLSFGPYVNFILYSAATEGINLFRRQIYTNPATDKAHFAMSDIHAGLGLALGYEFSNRWLVQLESKFGVTDILNLETPGTYVYPYRLTIGVGTRF